MTRDSAQLRADAASIQPERDVASESLNRAVASISDPEERQRVTDALVKLYALEVQTIELRRARESRRPRA